MGKFDKEPEFEVSIKDERRKLMPFAKMQSRVTVAIMLGFLGDSDEILNLMQRLSHTTRAYLVNA